MNLAEWLLRTAKRTPTAPPLLDRCELVSDYGRFVQRAIAAAAFLAEEAGVKSGDRVVVYMGNRTEYLELLYGIWFAGAVAVPINAKLHWREVAVIVQDCQPGLVFIDSVGQAAMRDEGAILGCTTIPLDHPTIFASADGALRDVPVSRAATDLAWLFYTSGTTGRPKGVMLSHGNLMAMSLTYLADVDEVSTTDAVLLPPRCRTALGCTTLCMCCAVPGISCPLHPASIRRRCWISVRATVQFPCSPRQPWCAASPMPRGAAEALAKVDARPLETHHGCERHLDVPSLQVRNTV